jgi:hypothetical protein
VCVALVQIAKRLCHGNDVQRSELAEERNESDEQLTWSWDNREHRVVRSTTKPRLKHAIWILWSIADQRTDHGCGHPRRAPPTRRCRLGDCCERLNPVVTDGERGRDLPVKSARQCRNVGTAHNGGNRDCRAGIAICCASAALVEDAAVESAGGRNACEKEARVEVSARGAQKARAERWPPAHTHTHTHTHTHSVFDCARMRHTTWWCSNCGACRLIWGVGVGV